MRIFASGNTLFAKLVHSPTKAPTSTMNFGENPSFRRFFRLQSIPNPSTPNSFPARKRPHFHINVRRLSGTTLRQRRSKVFMASLHPQILFHISVRKNFPVVGLLEADGKPSRFAEEHDFTLHPLKVEIARRFHDATCFRCTARQTGAQQSPPPHIGLLRNVRRHRYAGTRHLPPASCPIAAG